MGTAGLMPRTGMAQFATRTREKATEPFGKDSPAKATVDARWKKVGL